MEVTTTKILEWMDNQISAYKLARTRLVVNDDGDYLSNISITDNGIHVSSDALRFVAEKLNIDLCVKLRKMDKDYPYEIFVLYKGEKFFGIESEAEYREKGTVV